MKDFPEREEVVGFRESEEVEWRQYLTDFKTTIWPMFAAEGFSFPQAFSLWRQEMMLSKLTEIAERLGYDNS